jgi:hypothetical protein
VQWPICAGLRGPEEQLWLSRLSQAPAVHLLASIDHVNAALLWDNRTAAAFRWLWLDVTSYAAYKAETSSALPILTSECMNVCEGVGGKPHFFTMKCKALPDPLQRKAWSQPVITCQQNCHAGQGVVGCRGP